jgi:hypothetical protein
MSGLETKVRKDEGGRKWIPVAEVPELFTPENLAPNRDLYEFRQFDGVLYFALSAVGIDIGTALAGLVEAGTVRVPKRGKEKK